MANNIPSGYNIKAQEPIDSRLSFAGNPWENPRVVPDPASANHTAYEGLISVNTVNDTVWFLSDISAVNLQSGWTEIDTSGLLSPDQLAVLNKGANQINQYYPDVEAQRGQLVMFRAGPTVFPSPSGLRYASSLEEGRPYLLDPSIDIGGVRAVDASTAREVRTFARAGVAVLAADFDQAAIDANLPSEADITLWRELGSVQRVISTVATEDERTNNNPNNLTSFERDRILGDVVLVLETRTLYEYTGTGLWVQSNLLDTEVSVANILFPNSLINRSFIEDSVAELTQNDITFIHVDNTGMPSVYIRVANSITRQLFRSVSSDASQLSANITLSLRNSANTTTETIKIWFNRDGVLASADNDFLFNITVITDEDGLPLTQLQTARIPGRFNSQFYLSVEGTAINTAGGNNPTGRSFNTPDAFNQAFVVDPSVIELDRLYEIAVAPTQADIETAIIDNVSFRADIDAEETTNVIATDPERPQISTTFTSSTAIVENADLGALPTVEVRGGIPPNLFDIVITYNPDNATAVTTIGTFLDSIVQTHGFTLNDTTANESVSASNDSFFLVLDNNDISLIGAPVRIPRGTQIRKEPINRPALGLNNRIRIVSLSVGDRTNVAFTERTFFPSRSVSIAAIIGSGDMVKLNLQDLDLIAGNGIVLELNEEGTQLIIRLA